MTSIGHVEDEATKGSEEGALIGEGCTGAPLKAGGDADATLGRNRDWN